MPAVCDCRNMECPQPVVRTKKLLETERPDRIEVLVDNEAARENVTRLLAAQGYAVSHCEDGGVWTLTGVQGNASCDCPEADEILADAAKLPENAKTLVLLSAPVFGSGDDVLGIKLMRNFLLTLPEMGPALWRVIMLNGGVKLSVEDSPVLAELKALGQGGVSILVCGSCLEHFGLTAQKAVGETTNMLDVVTSMQLAGKVIRV